MQRIFPSTLVTLVLLSMAYSVHAQSIPITVEDYLKLPNIKADHRIAYGENDLQFGDLRLPGQEGPYPVVIVVHGGCWMAKYGLEPMSGFAAELSKRGVATWSLEYRRIGDDGGGWPGTFEDVAAGADYLRILAEQYPLDLSRVVAVGHSAGGHLAAWLAARFKIPKNSLLYSENPIKLGGLVELAGVPDMREALTGGLRDRQTECGNATKAIMGGAVDKAPGHFLEASPIELLPYGIPQHSIVGSEDNPHRLAMIKRYVKQARLAGDQAEFTVIAGAGHFDVVSTNNNDWPKIRDIILGMAGIH